MFRPIVRSAARAALIAAILVFLANMPARSAWSAEGVQRTSSPITTQLPLRDPDGGSLSRMVFRLRDLPLRAGQPVGLSGTLQVRAEYLASLDAQVMYCWPTGTSTRSYAVWSTTNHIGQEYGLPPGAVATTSGQWLFTPPTSGNYDCALSGQAGRAPYPAGYDTQSLTVVGGSLAIDLAPRPGGQEWRQPTSTPFQVGAAAKGHPTQGWVLVKKYDAPAGNNGFPKTRVYVGAQLSSYSQGVAGDAVADVTTYVTQLTAAGGMCKRYTKTTRSRISGKLHHLKIAQALSVPFDPSCSRRYAVQTLVKYVGGQGTQVEGASYTSAHAHPWT